MRGGALRCVHSDETASCALPAGRRGPERAELKATRRRLATLRGDAIRQVWARRVAPRWLSRELCGARFVVCPRRAERSLPSVAQYRIRISACRASSKRGQIIDGE